MDYKKLYEEARRRAMLRMPEEKFREIFPEIKGGGEDRDAYRKGYSRGYLDGMADVALRLNERLKKEAADDGL